MNDLKLKEKSIYDEIDESYKTTHKRWLYNRQILDDFAIKYNCSIIFFQEGYFSKNNNTETANPLLIRVIYKTNSN